MSEEIEQGTELTPEEQSALDRVRGDKDESSYVKDNFNEDGTPKDTFEMPDKFKDKSPEEIAKAYVELEKMKAKQAEEVSKENKEEPKEDKSVEEPKEDKSVEEPKEDKEITLLYKNDFTKYEQAYINDGSLSEEHYKELESKGFSKEIVDDYISSKKAGGEAYVKDIYRESGGEENYLQMVEWAKENFTKTQAERFDADIRSGDLSLAKEAIETLKLRMGSPARRIEGTGVGDGGLKPFANKSEYFEAVRNPAYKKDKTYAKMVDDRFIKAKTKGLW